MGVSGTAIFSDDDARDIRDEYRDLIGDGSSGPEATEKLLNSWKPKSDDSVFWLALAATQWRYGRLEDRVKQRALEIIENGADLERWKEDNPKLLPKRRLALENLRIQLNSPQPAPKRIARRYRNSCDWSEGEIVSYALLSGEFVLLRVIGTATDKGGTYAVCELLDWQGRSYPDLSALRHLPIRRNQKVTWRGNTLMLGETSAKNIPLSRLNRLHASLPPVQKNDHIGGIFVLWRLLDKVLAEDFGFR